MSDHEEASMMMRVAGRDLRALRGMSDAETFADELFGFMAQQTVEKCFKGWLCELGQMYPLTHDLAKLARLLKANGADLEGPPDLAELTDYAGEARYSDDWLGGATLDRQAVLAAVEAVFAHVSRQIRPDAPA